MLHGAKGRKLSTCPVDQGNKQLTVQVSQPAYTSPLGACLCNNLQADMNLVCLYPSQLKAARHITAESNLKYQLHQAAHQVQPVSALIWFLAGLEHRQNELMFTCE